MANRQATRNMTIMDVGEADKKKKSSVVIRQMEIDDLADVFHLGEKILQHVRCRISIGPGMSTR